MLFALLRRNGLQTSKYSLYPHHAHIQSYKYFDVQDKYFEVWEVNYLRALPTTPQIEVLLECSHERLVASLLVMLQFLW